MRRDLSISGHYTLSDIIIKNSKQASVALLRLTRVEEQIFH